MDLANFRELGGLKNKEGQLVSHNRLLRSGELYQIDAEAKNLLANHQLATIVDLRGEDEIAGHPDDIFPAVDYVWIDIMKEVHNSGSLNDLTKVGDVDGVDQHMLGIYDNLAMNAGAQAGYQRYFEELLRTEDGAVLFHCYAGKDRTGVAAALTLDLLDVPRETIYQDYLKTNELRKAPNELLFDEMRKKGLTDDQLAGMKVALEVKQEYLERVYQLLDTNYGGVAGYAKDALKLSQTDLADLKKMYLDK
ncbi:tyrosine-protein phosphatase [Enterococcus sp. HY326]|uniref:tyrosine-protein phosphatase n=1 Tax=Enterococcus sp. HY326 TaxID=2971265 RepID=UPI00223FFAD6|nr:tyrosine-protein phosphatase [Enterococcus sp. HY326]